jgi:hypothetical protein
MIVTYRGMRAIAEGLIDADTFDAAADICLKLYQFGVEYAASRGLILVDTKYEIGLLDGQLVVTDEVNTPDSSRYWYADSYGACFEAGQPQRQLDKEYVRTWLASQGFVGDGEPPVLADAIRLEAARRYILAYEQITGLSFEAGHRRRRRGSGVSCKIYAPKKQCCKVGSLSAIHVCTLFVVQPQLDVRPVHPGGASVSPAPALFLFRIALTVECVEYATTFQMAGVAQLVRASDCGSECRGFESRHPPHLISP